MYKLSVESWKIRGSPKNCSYFWHQLQVIRGFINTTLSFINFLEWLIKFTEKYDTHGYGLL